MRYRTEHFPSATSIPSIDVIAPTDAAIGVALVFAVGWVWNGLFEIQEWLERLEQNEK